MDPLSLLGEMGEFLVWDANVQTPLHPPIPHFYLEKYADISVATQTTSSSKQRPREDTGIAPSQALDSP